MTEMGSTPTGEEAPPPHAVSMGAPATVDEYMAELPVATRVTLEKLRKTIRATAPAATETISYQMPTFKLNGRFLVSYAAFKGHCSLFPASRAVMEAHGEELQPFFSGKGTLRFKPDKPIPAGLVKKIVRTRIEEAAAESPPRRRSSTPRKPPGRTTARR